MKKRYIVGSIVAGVLLIGALGSGGSQSSTSNVETNPNSTLNLQATPKETLKKATPICDGTVVTSNCAVDGVTYTTYVYHPAVEEKSHNETITTYREEITSYCTICNDGTYSPTCATGRGACSHHGGVAQKNAPRYSQVPEYTTKKVIDAPAVEAFYEKVVR